MIRNTLFLCLAAGAGACTTVSDSEDFSFTDVATVFVDVDKGFVDYSGMATASDVDVKVTSWATAGNRGKAETKQAENAYAATADNGELRVTGDTGFVQAGIDVKLNGPEVMDLNLNAGSGGITVRDVIGISQLSGPNIDVRNYEGDLTINSTSGVYAEVYPFEVGIVDIYASSGDCVVRLPAFAPMAVTIEFDPEQESVFSDLGFDDEFLDDGTYIASRNPGEITVNIRCPNGRVELLEHTLTW
jgi:ribosomal protein S11